MFDDLAAYFKGVICTQDSNGERDVQRCRTRIEKTEAISKGEGTYSNAFQQRQRWLTYSHSGAAFAASAVPLNEAVRPFAKRKR